MSARRSEIKVSHDRGVFMISVAAELAEMHPQTLRMYEARGLIEPLRSPKGTRLYSRADVDRLRRIQQMTAELGLNLAGVERVLELELQLEHLQRRVASLQREAELAHARREIELDRLRRSARADLVPFATGRALIRWVDGRSPFPPFPKEFRDAGV
jgi:MerR family transcriptional regulator, heat shock protein HspR